MSGRVHTTAEKIHCFTISLGEVASDRFGRVRHTGNELPTIATFLLAVAALRKPGHRMCRLGGRMAASGAAVASGTLPDMLRRMDSSAKRELNMLRDDAEQIDMQLREVDTLALVRLRSSRASE